MKMKFAMVNGQRREASPKLHGICLNCDREVISKCGSLRVWHWSHIGELQCDHWWEPETEWHRNWKACFPEDWREQVYHADSGERHIADVKAYGGMVLEFQHSPISPEERQSREAFYRQMVWVVDGLRLKRDWPSFREALSYAHRMGPDGALRWMVRPHDVPILRRWIPQRCPVYLDFGGEQFHHFNIEIGSTSLWRLTREPQSDLVVVTPVSRASFLSANREGGILRGYGVPLRRRTADARRPLTGFNAYLADHHRRRRSRF